MVFRRGATTMLVAVGCTLALLVGFSQAAVVEHTFDVGNLTLSRLCKERTVVAVNGQVPGPTIEAREGDAVVVHVLNNSPYNLTIHWHGIFQLLSAWADGPSYVTQCPILPGNKYTYRFNITGQEGTLWWHAHFSYLRSNVYGALIIRPRKKASAPSTPAMYPFGAKPYAEVPILLGEWWDANVVEVEEESLRSGRLPNVSDAFTINGLPGRLYPCGTDQTTYTLNLKRGETYLLRVINAAVNNQLFFKIAGHRFTVVAVDAGYTEPHSTDVLVLSPGQTVDALIVADADPRKRYYMAAHPYFGPAATGIPFDNTTTVGIVQYNKPSSPSTSSPVMPALPAFNDTPTAHRFYTSLVSSAASAAANKVPLEIHHKMFITFGLAFVPCDEASGPNCNPPFGLKFAATMNNVSFAFPTKLSMLEASFRGQTDGVFTRDFPDRPPRRFNYTDPRLPLNDALTVKGTKVKRLKYNETVQVVLQNVAFLGTENHPIHLHGFNFFVLAQGFGNYHARKAEKHFNLVNPLVRNTVAVPDGGWAVIRFVADNPGVWIMHCHLDVHLPIGLGMAFEVENGPTPSSTLPPPPEDFPRC